LNNPSNPTIYTPGPTASKTPDVVTCVAWHKTVPHIVASAFNNGSCVIWDLKNKRPVLNFVDPNRRQTRWRAVAWNPEESTQLISASDDDACPVLSVWDLRMTYAPSRYLEGHQKGIWAMSWCDHDSNLLLSCGRDNKTICWNASTGQIIDEIERELPTHWNFDVQWSPKLPAILATTSLEGKIGILSVPDLNPTRNQVSHDPFNPVPPSRPLGVPPKWLKRPCGSSFGWGGQLVSFTQSKRHITITKMGSEPEILNRADKLEQVVTSEEYKSFAEEKLASARNDEEKSTWAFIKVFVEKQNSRRDLLAYLGFEPSEISEKVKQVSSFLLFFLLLHPIYSFTSSLSISDVCSLVYWIPS
jgi:protein transport protein SEC31